MSVASPKRKPKRAKPTGNPWPELLRNLRADVGRREKLGRSLHQAEAAERLGVSRRSWIAWETGQQVPSNAYARLIPLTFRIKAD
jgi:DNA-binding XRE family transcriptional regulator